MFLIDCNADGLQDILLLFDGGYKIYFHNGGSDLSSIYTEANTREVTNSWALKNYWRMEQGDFNGDGLIDFVTSTSGESKLGFIFNNGDGTFTQSTKTNVDFVDQADSKKDDEWFAIRVADFDKDGLSDVMVSKKHLYDASRWYEDTYYRQDKTQVRWFRSDGIQPVLWRSYDKMGDEERDCAEAYIFTGDFNGDGYVEIANYGSNLDSATDNSFTENTINIYSFPTNASLGHIASITNGYNKTTRITYEKGTSPSVYTLGSTTTASTFPVNTYTLPIPLVSSVFQTNGAAGSESVSYSYEGLKLHVQGKGLLGFTALKTDNTTLGIQTERRITGWDQARWIPLSVSTTTTNAGRVSSSNSTYTISSDDSWHGNYFAYCSQTTATDYDNNYTRSIAVYDTARGVPTEECTYYGSGTDMYKKKEYTWGAPVCGKQLPSTVTSTQKHSDDSQLFTVTDTYTYDAKGDVVCDVITSRYKGDTVVLTTDYTRDSHGNVTAEQTSGDQVTVVTKYTQYDSNGLRKVREYTQPSSTVTTYTYDSWGNLASESDESNASNILTTTYTYDGWGRLVHTQNPDGTESGTVLSWDYNRPSSIYKTVTTATAKAPVTTYYDCEGREVYSSTVGPQNVSVFTTTQYNNIGKPTSVTKYVGQLHLTTQTSYDEFGRVVSTRNQDGTNTAYAYDNRRVTVTAPTGVTEKEYDAWGNVVEVSDDDLTTLYTYSSVGKPSVVDVAGNSVTMEYDGAGRRTELVDPDAGTQTYEYSADGKLLSQTDGNGVITEYTYDNLGRQTVRNCGSLTDTTVYGTSGNALNKVVSQSRNGFTDTYEYDGYGRVTKDTRNTLSGTFETTYAYNANGQVASVTYPGNVTVSYTYDTNGNLQSASANGTTYFTQWTYNGLKNQTRFGNGISTERLYPSSGMTAYKTIGFLGETDRINYRYDETTANVNLRWRGPVAFDVQQELNDYYSSGHTEYDAMHHKWSVNWSAYDNVIVPRADSNRYTVESFQYDDMDRLVSYENTAPLQLPIVRNVSYQGNGNIYSKTGVGLYHYDTDKPHAVSEITGLGNEIAHTGLTTSFNDDGKIDYISLTDDVETRNMYFYYGQGGEKWETFSFATSGSGSFISSKRHVYFGNYERITEGTSVTEQYFLDNDVILIQKDGVLSFYKAFTDAQGSILSVFDEYGNKVFDASYDAWGRQTVTQNDIDLHYGYCGHEMLPFDNLIDMGGRVYDSAIGRFLSCDNYVQEPDNSQNFNRYSYCLNNPLRYTDPTGELFGIDDAIIAFTVFNMANSMMQAAFNGQSIWKAAGISLLGSAASFGIGQLFGATGGFLYEAARAGTHGLATGLTTALSGGNFFSGFVSGASSSGIGSFAQGVHMPTEAMIGCTTVMGGLTSWATGGDFWQGAINGLAIGALNHAQHDIRYTRNANGDIQGEIPEVEVIGHRRYSLSISAGIGLAASAFEQTGRYWNNMGTSSKSRIVYNAVKFSKNHGCKITAKNAEIYRNIIPNGLNGAAKILGRASFATNVMENTNDIISTGRIGLGNGFDIAMAGISMTGWGTPLSIGYLGADYLYFQFYGVTIREELNNVGSIYFYNQKK